MTDRSHHPDPDSLTWRDIAIALVAVLIVIVLSLIGQALHPTNAQAHQLEHATATWYGPGFYGHPFACSHLPNVPDHYNEKTSRGVAHMTLPCGTKLTLCHHHHCVRVIVIDTGAFDARNFDLTARTARDLLGCRSCRPHTMSVHWRRGWLHPLNAQA